MEKLRYNRTFKKGLTAIVFCILLFVTVIILFVVSNVQYRRLTDEMSTVNATIVDTDLNVHVKGPNEQEIYVAYEVDGVTYSRELGTDTAISFSPGIASNYSIGDSIEILYDPDNPEVIAVPRSMDVGGVYTVVAFLGLALVLFVLFLMIKHHRGFLVTQEEYEQEKINAKNKKRG